jgi:chromosome segregation ATPase
MKLPIPTFRNTIALVGAVKDLLPNNNTSDSSLLRVIEEQADAIYSKKQEIAVLEKKVEDLEGIYKSLKRRIWELEETLTITSDELREAEIRASEAGG